jgi:ammonia channel protein AmtB
VPGLRSTDFINTTWIILWVTDKVVGLRVSPEDEAAGLDLSEHGEPADYQDFWLPRQGRRRIE